MYTLRDIDNYLLGTRQDTDEWWQINASWFIFWICAKLQWYSFNGLQSPAFRHKKSNILYIFSWDIKQVIWTVLDLWLAYLLIYLCVVLSLGFCRSWSLCSPCLGSPGGLLYMLTTQVFYLFKTKPCCCCQTHKMCSFLRESIFRSTRHAVFTTANAESLLWLDNRSNLHNAVG